MNVRLTKEQKTKILNSKDVYAIMQQVLLRENKIHRNQEHFWIVGLDNQNKVLFIELLSLGGSNRLVIKPRDVFRMAIYKLAVKAVLVHNHPSGEVEPSKGDKDTTDKLIKSGDMLGVEIVDHLIISEEKFLSFTDTGLLEELKNSGFYVLMEREKEELTKYKLELEKERAADDRALEIAKKLKGLGLDEKDIKKATGLRIGEIREL